MITVSTLHSLDCETIPVFAVAFRVECVRQLASDHNLQLNDVIHDVPVDVWDAGRG